MKFYLKFDIILCFCIISAADASDASVSLGYVGTELGKNGANIAIDYVKKIEPNLTLFKAGESSLLSFTPDIKVLLGSNDAFNGVIAKYTGMFMFFSDTNIAGVTTPNLSKMYHIFPISAGMETNKNVDFVNGIVEVGYMPMVNSSRSTLLRSTILGVFIQGGYRYGIIDSTGYEVKDEGLFRVKGVVKLSPKWIFKNRSGFGIIMNANVWYDAIGDKKLPYTISGKIRFIYEEKSIDFGYQKGSGEPNFQSGEQWTSNLTVDF